MRLKRTITTAGTLVACATPATALARDDVSPPPSLAARITVSSQLGYAYPVGATERGNGARDVSFGLIPLSLIGAYDLGGGWNTRVSVRYAPNIPTLCASGPDCFASVGHDLGLMVGIGRSLPRWGGRTPELALEVGWEWLTTELSDSGVTASRSWNGPAASLELFFDLKSSGPWSLGPAVGVTAGIFSRFDLETPARRTGGGTDTAIHAWPAVAFRVGRRL